MASLKNSMLRYIHVILFFNNSQCLSKRTRTPRLHCRSLNQYIPVLGEPPEKYKQCIKGAIQQICKEMCYTAMIQSVSKQVAC